MHTVVHDSVISRSSRLAAASCTQTRAHSRGGFAIITGRGNHGTGLGVWWREIVYENEYKKGDDTEGVGGDEKDYDDGDEDNFEGGGSAKVGTGVFHAQVCDARDERRDGDVRERQGSDVHVSRRGA